MDGYLEWDINMNDRTTLPSGEIIEVKKPLTFHQCNDADKRSYLFDYKASQKAVEEGLWPNLLCLDHPEDVVLNGHGTTIQRNVITFDLKKCRGKANCKEDSEILKFINQRQIMFVYNQ